jgi:3-methyl-2-oxobutanoate hydroxymethyltransferase
MSSHPTEPAPTARKPVTLPALLQMRERGEAITMLTCYDASFARLLDDCGVDCVLVGDSLGMVMQGHGSTLPVTLADVAYHTQCVARGLRASWLISDLPFGSYGASPQQALDSATRLMQAGAQMVKLEGGAWLAPTVAFLVERGIPVCAHLGLTPQSVHALGGYRIQGRTDAAAAQLLADARALQDAGASMLVLELIPAPVAVSVTEALRIPTIGIGAGNQTSGQVLVCYDLLGLNEGFSPKFLKRYAQLAETVRDATRAYISEVRERSFPGPEHSFKA